jgi:hypothetical protein
MQATARTPLAVLNSDDGMPFQPVTRVTDSIPLTGSTIMVTADPIGGAGSFTVVAITDDGQRIPVFNERLDEMAALSAVADVPELAGAESVVFENPDPLLLVQLFQHPSIGMSGCLAAWHHVRDDRRVVRQPVPQPAPTDQEASSLATAPVMSSRTAKKYAIFGLLRIPSP